MITGEIKNKVDKIWTDIWADGITNPLTIIEQLTYLMFIRSLDEKDTETEQLENLSGENESAFSRYMGSAMFLIPMPQVLQKIITGLDDIYEHDIATPDMQGDLYEYMLNKLSQSGTNGQFRTPSHIIKMMVALLDPKPDDRICEIKTQNLIQINDCPLRGVA